MRGGDERLVWIPLDRVRRPATRSLSPGISVYGEKIVVHGGVEYRVWDPFRSKLAAALINGLRNQPIAEGSRVLYLGVSTGTTAGHISDLIRERGILYGVEFAARVAREFIEHVAKQRSNVIPIVEDARRPERYAHILSRVDVAYVDIAQPDQTEIAMANCRLFLIPGGDLLLVIKSPSIDVTRPPREVFQTESNKLQAEGFSILDSVNLEPFDRAHLLIHAQSPIG